MQTSRPHIRHAADVRTDVYALGVMLYELLTGTPLVAPGLSLAESIRAITETEPTPPSKVKRNDPADVKAPPIDRDLDVITLKALNKRPEDRYDTAAALRDDLQRHLNNEPITARRPGGWYLFTRLIRRHRYAAVASAVLLATLVGATAVMAVLYQRATTEAAKARQINVFLEDTLGSVSPMSPEAPVVLTDVLDEAVHWVDIALNDQPEIAASIRATIGNSYRSLGAFEKAGIELQKSLALRRELFGASHPEVAAGLNALALLRKDQRRLSEAQSLYEQALIMRRELLGERSLPVAQSAQNLGVLHMQQGNWSDAADDLELARSIRAQHLGPDHPDTLMCRFQIADLAARSGHIDRARRIHADVLEKRRRRLHPNHPDIARSCRALGALALESDDFAAAADFYAECYELLKAIHGCRHPKTSAAADDWATALTAAGDESAAQRAKMYHQQCTDNITD